MKSNGIQGLRTLPKRLLLLSPEPDEILHSSPLGYSLPNLGLIHLRGFLQSKIPDIDIKILDGNLVNESVFLDEINNADSTIIGISMNISNVRNGVKYINIAHQNKGIELIVLGGIHPALFPEEFVRKYHTLVVIGDGEMPLYKLLTGHPIRQIEGVAFLDESGKFVLNPPNGFSIDYIPYAFRLKTEMEASKKRFLEFSKDSRQLFHMPAHVLSHKGCYYRIKKGGCSFCSRGPYEKLILRNPENFWSEVRYLNENFGCDAIIDVGENCFFSLLKSLLKHRPEGKIPFFVFITSPEDIYKNPEMIDVLKELNCIQVKLGVESGDDNFLSDIKKRNRRKSTIEAIKLLKEAGIYASIGIMIGLPNQDWDDLQHTIDFVEEIVKIGNILEVRCSIFTPLPGSPVYSLIRDEIRSKHKDEELITVNQLQEFWVPRYTKLKMDQLIRVQEDLETLFRPKTKVTAKPFSMGFG